MIAFPMILPMGWVDSPNYLCAVTETICDLANARFSAGDLSDTPHRLEVLASSAPVGLPRARPTTSGALPPPPAVRSRGPLQRPLNTVDVYMDDLVSLTQGSASFRGRARRTLFECIDAVLRPLSESDNPRRKEPNSTKKLEKGDAAWTTRKVVLGWLLDTVRRTIELPPHRVSRLQELLGGVPRHQRRTSRQKWQQLLGELRSMVLAIPGGRGLLSQLQSVLVHSPHARPTDRLTLSKPVHDQLDDLRWLARDLAARPTRWGEVVDSDPAFLGAVDASAAGMGGVWLDTRQLRPPLMWRQRFPQATTDAVVSWSNPTGTLTNSDLEQAGLVCQPDILSQQYDIREQTICALSDNTAALSRDHRGSTSVDAPSAYLCRLASLHQRAYRYRLRSAHLPGTLNVMADALSRRWDLDDSQLLDLFTSSFPQERPWTLCTLRPEMNSSAIQALWKTRCEPAFLTAASLPPPLTGTCGPYSVNNVAWRPTSPRMPIQSRSSKYSLSEYATAGFRPAVCLSELARWQTPSSSSHRRTQWLACPTPGTQ